MKAFSPGRSRHENPIVMSRCNLELSAMNPGLREAFTLGQMRYHEPQARFYLFDLLVEGPRFFSHPW